MSTTSVEPKLLDVGSYMTIRKYITYLKSSRWSRTDESNKVTIEHGQGTSARLVDELQNVWSPFCLTGKINRRREHEPDVQIFKNSSLLQLDIKELLANAKQSPFGHGTTTVTDTSVRNSFEIDASKFKAGKADQIAQTYIDISDMCPGRELKIRPYKLVLYEEGGHFDEHRDTVRGEGHIGTLVLVLNSEYTGGELEVTHGGHTETVTGAYSWVAMYGDCLHKINPVTSGTRVSLIYDIYATDSSASVGEDSSSDEDRDEFEEEEEEEEEDVAFWNEKREAETPATVRPMDAKQKKSIARGVNNELKQVHNLIITLQHLYPECQTSPAFLKGGDRALFDLLSEHFDVQVVAATIYRTYHEQDKESEVFFDLFSPSLVAEALLKDPYEGLLSLNKKPKQEPVLTKIVIPNYLLHSSVLDYTPYCDYTGNESQAEETVYIVAGLQVRKRD